MLQQTQALWRRQLAEWPMLRKGLDGLRQSKTRTFNVAGSQVVIQFNPVRAGSASAKVDAASLAARPCFLCPENRPAEQRAVEYGRDWMVLCNPFPIFDPHFTIINREHAPQRLASCAETILKLAHDFQGCYSVFYNGPLCGASAPDHLHLQASPAGVTPFERELAAELCVDRARNGHRWIDWVRAGDVQVGITTPGRRAAVVMIGHAADTVRETLDEVLTLLGQIRPAEPEPMMNLFAEFVDGRWLIWLYPRQAHRPSNYGKDPDQFLVSPGAADLAGLLITPKKEDFDRMTAEDIKRFYDEVLLSPDSLAILRDRLTR